MKYVITKDGRIIDTSTYLDKCFVKQQQGGECKWEKIDFGNGCWCCRFNELTKVKIVKQADSIEELCDEFVRVCEPNTKNECRFVLNSKDSRFLINNEHIDYGAIWIKGEHDEPILKSVAKMNEKGELELI